jgi:hypothetical protein
MDQAIISRSAGAPYGVHQECARALNRSNPYRRFADTSDGCCRHSPLRVLLERHGDLNHRCLSQTYPLRGFFFHYLHDTYGKEAVFRLAYAEDEMTGSVAIFRV